MTVTATIWSIAATNPAYLSWWAAARPQGGDYPDIDMRFTAEGTYVHKDGRPYEAKRV